MGFHASNSAKVFSRDGLAQLSAEQWAILDLDGFFLTYIERVISSFLGTHGSKLANRDYVERADLVSELYVEGFPRLQRRFEKRLDIEPENRFGLLYGTLTAVANTALRSKIPTYSLIPSVNPSPIGSSSDQDEESQLDALLLGNEEYEYRSEDEIVEELEENERALTRMVELLRGQFNPAQFTLLREIIFNGKTLAEIAETEGRQQANVWWSIEQLRVKLHSLLPGEMQDRDEYVTFLPKRSRDSKLKKTIRPLKTLISSEEYELLLQVLTKPMPPEKLAMARSSSVPSLSQCLSQVRSTICRNIPALCDDEGHFLLATLDRYAAKYPELGLRHDGLCPV